MSLQSGIKCDKEVASLFTDIRNKSLRYVTCRIRSGPKSKVISVDKYGKRDATFDDFLKDIPKDIPRYCVFDFAYETSDLGKRERLMFIYWCPFQNASLETKTLYSASKAEILSTIKSSQELIDVEITDLDDLTEVALTELVKPIREREIIDVGGRINA